MTGLIPAPGSFFTAGELSASALSAAAIAYEDTADGTPQKRLIEHQRTLYLEDGLGGPLPLEQIESLTIKYETYQLAFTPGLIGQLYRSSPKVDENILSEAKYVHSQGDDNWWIPSGTSVYAVDAPDRFYLPTGFKDPFGNIAGVKYDSYDFLTVKTKDPLGNEVKAENDYRLLQPVLMTGANRNRTAVAADELGKVIKKAVMGKEGAGEGDTLSDPTILMAYDLFNWLTNGKPNFVHTSARETHGDPAGRRQESYTYSDGSGNVIMAKAQAEPGIARQMAAGGNVIDVDTTPEVRWVGNGRTSLNNKGKPVKQYEPYFSVTHEYEDAEELVETGVTPLLYYDPPGRLIKTENPNGTFSRVAFDPWKQSFHDENDTVLESRWYTDRGSPDPTDPIEPSDAETRAAWLAAKHAGTPEVKHMDPLGRIFYSIADNGSSGRYPTAIRLDIEGNERKTSDARGNTVMENGFDMLGSILYQKSMDSGELWTLNNVEGNPVWKSDNLEDESSAVDTRITYDELQRPTHLWVKQGTTAEILAERIIYGEEHPDSQSLCLLNLRGQVYIRFDGAGLVTNRAFDFKSNLLRSTRQLAKEYKQVVDWNVPDRPALLEPEIFESRNEFDALSRPVRLLTPHTSQIPANGIFPSYNEAGLLDKVEVKLRGAADKTVYVENIDYDAKGRREKIEYGSGVYTEYKYDPDTFRVINVKTIRPPGNKELQDFSYTYDPVGNIVEIKNHALQTLFFNNTVVEPHTKYEYDAMYRLVKVKGREHAGGGAPPDAHDEFRTLQPHPGDAGAMRSYTRAYEYDGVNNIMKMIHQAAGGDWTRTYDYPADNNRLIQSMVGSITESPTYDRYGNMTAMLHLDKMEWDFNRRFFHMERGTVNVWYTYDADGKRVRKVVEKQGGIREERIYLRAFEIYRKTQGNTLELERESLHIMDQDRRTALVETKTIDTAIPAFTPVTSVRYQFSNYLDSAALELDDSGKIISYEEYYPFGGTSFQSGRSLAEVSLKRYRFTAKERDGESGLYYHGARYYAPWLGRWTGCDPAGLAGGINGYAYVKNNPVTFCDPTGFDDFVTEIYRYDPRKYQNPGEAVMVPRRAPKPLWAMSPMERAMAPTGMDAVQALMEEFDAVEIIDKYNEDVREDPAVKIDAKVSAAMEKVNAIEESSTAVPVTRQQYTNLEGADLEGPNAIVLHRTAAPTASSTLNHYRTSTLGAHFLIDEAGKVYQTADLEKRTSHVGKVRSRCERERNCTDAERRELRDARRGPRRGRLRRVHDVEAAKDYPDRYPVNADSIGIEVVGEHSAAAGFAEPTEEQLLSVGSLVRALQQRFDMEDEDVYRHGDIAYKQPTEGHNLGY